jgi:uncharacterized protein YdhG (YjbR/CyaY superfamily)
METHQAVANTVDEYISGFSPEVQAILRRIRQVVHEAAPEAQEAISYRMPAFKQEGILVYFAAFKNHIGLYPPVTGDTRIQKATSPYAGEKGNLRFLFDKPIPYDLITRITELRLKQNLAKAATKRTKVRAISVQRRTTPTGEGWQSRMDGVLRQYVTRHSRKT